MQKGPPIIIVVIISIITSLFLTISFNHQHAPDKIDPHAQYEIYYIDVTDKYGDGIDICLESRSEHNLRITILINTYEPNRDDGFLPKYNALKEIYLQSGESYTFSTDASKILHGATIEEVIVEPAPPHCVNLTWLAILTFLMFGIESFIFMEDSYDIILTENLWFAIPVYLLSTIALTTVWMRLFMWITQALIKVDVLFRIFGRYF